MIDFKFKNLNAIHKFTSLKKLLPDEVMKGLGRSAVLLINTIVINLRSGKFGIKTDTGRLKGSFSHKIFGRGKKAAAIVGTTLIYAKIHEEGGAFQTAKWYVRGSMFEAQPDIKKIMNDIIKIVMVTIQNKRL